MTLSGHFDNGSGGLIHVVSGTRRTFTLCHICKKNVCNPC